MEIHEHRKLAEVEDGMWYFRSLHRHVLREARRALPGHRGAEGAWSGMPGGVPADARLRLDGNTAGGVTSRCDDPASSGRSGDGNGGAARDGASPPAEDASPEAVPRLLDAGCGTGGLLCRLHEAEPTWDLTGLDYSSFACEVARKRCPAARIHQGSTTALPFAEGSFDLVLSADVLCQITEHREALAELHRCLRPGGSLVVNVPAYRWLWSYHDVAVGGKYRFGRGELHRLVGDAGFVGIRSTHWNTLPFPVVVVRRKLMPSGHGAASDVRAFPPPVEATFRCLMAAEHAWIQRVSGLPYGSSILLTARKA